MIDYNILKKEINQNLKFIPLKHKSKLPRDYGWDKMEYTPQDFKYGDNIGLHLVDVIDIDIDNPTCHKFLDKIKSKCGRIYGRKSNPDSHLQFKGNTAHKKIMMHTGFIRYYEKFSHGRTIIEIRNGIGKQSVFPGSIINNEEVKYTKEDQLLEYDGNIQKDIAQVAFATMLTIIFAPKGTRDDFCYAVGCILARHGNWKTEKINDLIYKVAVAAGHSKDAKSFQKRDFESKKGFGLPTLKKILNVNYDALTDLFKVVGVDVSNDEEDQEEVEEELNIKPFIYGTNIEIQKRSFVLSKYLKKGNVTLFQGAPGGAKTQNLCQLAYCYATGYQYFGQSFTETGNALLLTAEEEINEINLRLRATEKSIGPNNTDHKIHILGNESELKLVKYKKSGDAKSAGFEWLNNFVKTNKIGFIGLDPLISYQGGHFDENSNALMDNYIKNYIIPIARDNNACLAVNHHTNKVSMANDAGVSDAAMTAGRGASALPAAARIVVGLAPMSKQMWEADYKELIVEGDRRKYVALVDAKNNYAANNDIPLWVEKRAIDVECKDGIENVAVLLDCNLTELKDAKSVLAQEKIKNDVKGFIEKIHNIFENNKDLIKNNTLTVNNVSKTLAISDPDIKNTEEKTVVARYRRKLLNGLAVTGISFGGYNYVYEYDTLARKDKHIIKRYPRDNDHHF